MVGVNRPPAQGKVLETFWQMVKVLCLQILILTGSQQPKNTTAGLKQVRWLLGSTGDSSLSQERGDSGKRDTLLGLTAREEGLVRGVKALSSLGCSAHEEGGTRMEQQTQQGPCVLLAGDTSLAMARQTLRCREPQTGPAPALLAPLQEPLPSSSSLSFRGENTSELSQKEIGGRKWKV